MPSLNLLLDSAIERASLAKSLAIEKVDLNSREISIGLANKQPRKPKVRRKRSVKKTTQTAPVKPKTPAVAIVSEIEIGNSQGALTPELIAEIQQVSLESFKVNMANN